MGLGHICTSAIGRTAYTSHFTLARRSKSGDGIILRFDLAELGGSDALTIRDQTSKTRFPNL